MHSEPVLHFRNLKIAYSLKCNARCRHCVADAHPQQIGKLSKEIVFQCIEDAAACGFSRVEFTGGEIMIFENDLEEFLARAYMHGLRVTLNTNGFWAKTAHRADQILTRLCERGVDRLILSTDTYHAEYIDPKRVVYAIRAAQEIGIKCSVTVCTMRNDVRLLEIIALIRPHSSQIKLQTVGPYGRARSLDHDAMYRCSFEEACGPCSNIYAPFVLPDGRVSLCCAPPAFLPSEVAHISPLILGWLGSERLSSILNRAKDDPLLNQFAAGGLHSILDDLNRTTATPYSPKKDGYLSRCELCMEMFGREEMISQIKGLQFNGADATLSTSAREEPYGPA